MDEIFDKNANYVLQNSLMWDKWVKEKCIWTIPITHEEFIAAKNGNYFIYITPTKPVPQEWLKNISNSNILVLAGAGGQQAPILVAAGANVTVFDNSAEQIKSEQMIAEREGYSIKIIQGDMSKKLPFDDESFDCIINPISNSYIFDVFKLWTECYRVLKKGGSLISGFANPDIYMFDTVNNEDLKVKNKLPLNPLTDFGVDTFHTIINKDGIQFSHTLEEQIGGQLNAGFILTGFYEDGHPTDKPTNYNTYIGNVASKLTEFTSIYFATKSIK